jgi:hypothetical protein
VVVVVVIYVRSLVLRYIACVFAGLEAGGLAFKRGSVTIELLVVFNGDMSILKQMREPSIQ